MNDVRSFYFGNSLFSLFLTIVDLIIMASEPTGTLPFPSTFDSRIHPLSSSPSSGFLSSTTTSNGGIAAQLESVTTIFVVGFPDDMTEREFQNMFTFSPGFEAASLKWHSKDQEDENLGSNNNKKQMVWIIHCIHDFV